MVKQLPRTPEPMTEKLAFLLQGLSLVSKALPALTSEAWPS